MFDKKNVLSVRVYQSNLEELWRVVRYLTIRVFDIVVETPVHVAETILSVFATPFVPAAEADRPELP